MKKKIITLALCTFMLLSLLPMQVFADLEVRTDYPDADAGNGYNSNVSGEEIFSAMMEQAASGKAPDSFYDDTLTPYGTQKGEAFTLLEKAEIFEYISNSESVKNRTFYDNLAEGRYSVTSGIKADMTDPNYGDYLSGLRFARGVAFDPTGSGHRDYVAIIGFKYDGLKEYSENNMRPTASFHLYIVSAETKRTVCHKTFTSGSDFRYGNFINELTVVDSGNFVQITAGDYNGDGCDSLIIYDGIGLYEVSYANFTYTPKRIDNTGNGKSYLNDAYKKSTLSQSWQLRNQLCMALASGDVNGDGIDDLIALSYTGDIDPDYVYGSKGKYFNTTCIPQLSVGYGERNAKKTAADLSISQTSVYQDLDNQTKTTLACPGVAVGDIDGDGKNEIITAGFLNKSVITDVMIVDDSKNADTIAYAYYKTSGARSLQRVGNIRTIKRGEVSGISRDESLREHEYLFQQVSVECVALEGKNTQEYVFLNGYFYCLDDFGDLQGIASNKMSKYQDGDFPNLFNDTIGKGYIIGDNEVQEIFIQSASVGNVFGDDNGKEAILLVVGYKSKTGENQESSYHYKQCIYYDRGRNDSSDMKTETVWFSIFGERGLPMKKLTGNQNSEGSYVSGSMGSPSMLLIAVDYGTDSVVGRYSGKAYAYTDPTPVAFLQAAPYFSELGAENSSTQYSYSEGYRVTTGTSDEVSFNVGFASEIEAGAVKASMEAGLAYELNREFTKSIDKTFTTTFEANDQNQVILRQTMMYYYYYDVQVYKDGKYVFLPSALIISAPQYPVLTSLSMDQYNAFATAYNNAVAASTASDVNKSHKMELITDALKEKYFLNNEGNPFAYARSAAAYTYNNGIPGWDLSQAKVGDTDTWMKLSYAGGTQTQTYSVTLEEEKTKSVAEGGYANMSLMVGGGIGSFEAYAGITAEYERLKGSSISTASMTSTETSGTVQNLSYDLTDYGFDWKLIGWKTDDLFKGVPFVGYAVRNQKDLPMAIDDLKATYSNGTVTLTFTAPKTDSGRMVATHFYAYDDLHDKYIGACSYADANPEHSITIDVSGYTEQGATFTVIPFNANRNLRGLPSNEVYCLFAMSDKETSALIQELKDKISELTGSLDEQKDDFETKLAELIAAYKAADALLKSQVDTEQKAAREALSAAMAEADKALKEAIDKVNADLSEAIEKLSRDTDEALDQTITDLTNAYISADALLKADIDSLSEELTALEQKMNEADDALLAAIEQVKADLDAAQQDLESALAEEAERLNNKIKTLNAALEAAYKLADEMLKNDIDGLSQRLDEAEAKHKEDIDALRSELEAKHKEDIDALRSDLEAKHKEDIDALFAELDELRTQIAEQDEIDGKNIDTNRTLSIIGLCIGSVSLLCNGVMLFSLLKKKSLTKV
ncbi:MAG: hypothetical protein PUC63_01985 [Clostridiales bacterium]|nr:hypothetical protein [Clostridiales bacterium]